MRSALPALLIFLIALPTAAGPAPRLIRIQMEEYAFLPPTIALKSGEPIRLELENVGTVQHQFRSDIFRGVDVWVRTAGFDVRAERTELVVVRPGATVTLELVRRNPGVYEFWCGELTNGRRHSDLGMRGRFIVTP